MGGPLSAKVASSFIVDGPVRSYCSRRGIGVTGIAKRSYLRADRLRDVLDGAE